MWKTRKFTSILLWACVIGLFLSCSGNEIPFVDTALWKKDLNGCTGYRNSVKSQFDGSKDLLLGKDDVFAITNLGKPNRVSYSERGRKMFVYYVSQTADCKNINPEALVLEFNATGFIQMLYIQTMQ